MKIVILYNMFSPYRIDLFDYLSKIDKYEITVLYFQKIEDNRQWEIDETNIKHKYIILNTRTIKLKQKLDVKYIHISLNVNKVLNKINPDIVIGYGYNPTVFQSFIWSKKNNKRYISWTDGTLTNEKNINFIQKYLRKRICKNSDALIASSTKAKKAQLTYGADIMKIFISYLTVDIDKYIVKRNGYNKINILYVGSLIKRKGVDLLIKALKDINLPYTLNIIGTGTEEKALKELIINNSLNTKINFLGFKQRSEIIEYYRNADIFVLPTREDCFGLVIIEAMCAGLPLVISKYADGAYDLIEEGKNGFIIDPNNTKEFASKIELLLSDKNSIERMGNYSSRKVKEFSLANVSKEFIKAIEFVTEEVKL